MHKSYNELSAAQELKYANTHTDTVHDYDKLFVVIFPERKYLCMVHPETILLPKYVSY